MHNLLIVHILHHLQKLAGYLPAFKTGMPLGEPFFKRHTIYPFHHDTSAVSLNFLQPFNLHNTGMVKAGKDVIFLLLKLQEGRIMTHISLTTLNVRKEPSTDADRIGKLDPGASVEYLRDHDDTWAVIKYNGQEAYVAKEFLTAE